MPADIAVCRHCGSTNIHWSYEGDDNPQFHYLCFDCYHATPPRKCARDAD